MTLEVFRASTAKDNKPSVDLPETLKAMWFDARGDWDQAHDIAQEIDGRDGSWIHAYLHRKEGDTGNAAYWYRRAGKPFPSGLSLEEEWEELAGFFCGKL